MMSRVAIGGGGHLLVFYIALAEDNDVKFVGFFVGELDKFVGVDVGSLVDSFVRALVGFDVERDLEWDMIEALAFFP